MGPRGRRNVQRGIAVTAPAQSAESVFRQASSSNFSSRNTVSALSQVGRQPRDTIASHACLTRSSSRSSLMARTTCQPRRPSFGQTRRSLTYCGRSGRVGEQHRLAVGIQRVADVLPEAVLLGQVGDVPHPRLQVVGHPHRLRLHAGSASIFCRAEPVRAPAQSAESCIPAGVALELSCWNTVSAHSSGGTPTARHAFASHACLTRSSSRSHPMMGTHDVRNPGVRASAKHADPTYAVG